MSGISVESIGPCPNCGSTATVSEDCYVCGADDLACRACAGSGKLRSCACCGHDRSKPNDTRGRDVEARRRDRP